MCAPIRQCSALSLLASPPGAGSYVRAVLLRKRRAIATALETGDFEVEVRRHKTCCELVRELSKNTPTPDFCYSTSPTGDATTPQREKRASLRAGRVGTRNMRERSNTRQPELRRAPAGCRVPKNTRRRCLCALCIVRHNGSRPATTLTFKCHTRRTGAAPTRPQTKINNIGWVRVGV